MQFCVNAGTLLAQSAQICIPVIGSKLLVLQSNIHHYDNEYSTLSLCLCLGCIEVYITLRANNAILKLNYKGIQSDGCSFDDIFYIIFASSKAMTWWHYSHYMF